MVLLYAKFQNYEVVRRQLHFHLATSPPKLMTIKAVFQQFQQTGSVEDLPRSGRPATSTTPERFEQVQKFIAEDPSTSVSCGAAALGLQRTSYHCLLVKLDLKSYRPPHVSMLSDCDFDRQKEFSITIVDRFHADPYLIDHMM